MNRVDAAGVRTGSYVLPAAFTVLNLFLGYLAIVKTLGGDHRMAALLILVSAVFDKLDGLVARATNATSDFGRELDSLADVISFGCAPAVVAYGWALQDLRAAGWVAAFVFLACGALRLARFNVQTAVTDKRWFVGLPIPMAATVPMSVVLAADLTQPGVQLDRAQAWLYLGLVLAIGLLMVSRFRYFSFKDVHFGRERRLVVVLGLVAVIAAVAAWPEVLLPLLAGSYAASGPVLRAVRAVRGSASTTPGAAS